MLYHVSKTAGLTVLTPQRSTHGKAYVYAVETLPLGLLFGAPHDDFDFIIDEEGGVPIVTECYPDAFRAAFQGKGCSIYEVDETGFQRGMTTWEPELVCESEVAVLRETAVDDLYARLLQEEARGSLLVQRYEDAPEYKRCIAAHIVDRLIRFDAVETENERLRRHYGRILDALRSAMDGHLL